ncbi:TonB-dependent receptor [Simiduia agarivorans]|uniref:TonB-dependent receptor n=1 Tax=Simiduia agarivorans (strain DSM 21679 / JCM 13881 / BCRC 17597 / SA1) TaxID=1117647 RepID=K4KVW7_SIMAS|nr:TonB-dependent receptor [Simiduia agarivorans]AFU98082.1 TonB-dependent receptor [Simiduia agarivorans SA1 = DSM 21679]
MSTKLSDAIKKVNRALVTVGSLGALSMVAVPAFAQDAASEIEEIQVLGIRGSLKAAADIKRDANAVVDAVTAEDIGKLPDSDVGQALGRIPGVSVGRAFGQGASVSIRGSDPQMTYTTLNGQSVASTGWFDQQAQDRSFNYSLLPSELIGGMDVYKSTQADLAEGGIGGTVIVKTRRPFELEANKAFLSLKGGMGTVSDDFAPEVSGLYSWKDDSETFGILVAAARAEGDYVRRGVEADTRWSSDVAPTTFVQERERTAFDINAQVRPTENLEFGAHILSMELVGDNSNTSHYIFPDANCTLRNDNVTSGFNPNGVCLKSETTAANATDAFIQTWARSGKMTSDTYSLDGTYELDGFKAEAVIGSTKAEGGTSLTTNYSYGWWTAGSSIPQWTGTIDATGKVIDINPSSDQSVSVADLGPTVAPAGSWATTKGPNSDEETFAQLDFTFDVDFGAISSIKTGVRSTQHEFKKQTLRSVFVDAADIVSVPTESLYSGTIKTGPNGWTNPRPNIGAMMANTLDNIDSFVEERPGFGLLKEDNLSAYVMANFEGEGFRGNFGLRYVQTDASATGYDLDGTPLAPGDVAQNNGWGTALVTDKSSYSDVLPSVNVVFDLTEDLLLRFSAGQAITRANYENMFRGQMAGFQDTVAGNETVTFGDPGLLPQKSSQADLGVEYYYGDGNVISVAYFKKDIENFISTVTEVDQQIGVISPDSGLDSWTVNQYINAGGGKIDGFEFQVNHAFDNGFGTSVNYTYANGNAPAESFQDNIGVFTLSSQHVANIVGYWENDQFSARAAYNYRSEYMVRETGWYGNRMHDDFGTLDLSFGWNVTDMINLTFEANNILEADDVQYGAAAANTTVKDPLKEGYPAWSFMGEASYKLGLNVRF